MMEIVELLGLRELPDFHQTEGGCIAVRRPDVAPLAYEVTVNAPVQASTLEKLVEYGQGASASMIRRLYGLCNGMKVGFGGFDVYGIPGGQMDRSDVQKAVHIPFDINDPNIYGRPKDIPDDALIVASGNGLRGSGSETSDPYHIITPDDRIVVATAGRFEVPERTYSTVDAWLVAEFHAALSGPSGDLIETP